MGNKVNKKAIIVRLTKEESGKFRVNLDDLVQGSNNNWMEDAPYTFKDYDKANFEELEFDEKELADFGYSILARLYAFYKHGAV